jgi:hypothetical protein
MADALAKSLMDRQSQLEAIRAPWETLWRKVSELVLPDKADFSGFARGEQRNLRQYDAFPMGALDKFAAAIEAGLTPPSAVWHKLMTGIASLDDDIEARRYLDALNLQIWRARYSPMSGFVGQAHEVRLDLGLFGTGCMLIEARRGGGIRYQSVHLSEIWIDIGHMGQVDTVHRKTMMTARQIVQKFGDQAPKKARDAFDKGEMGREFEILHCCRPAEDGDKRFPGRSYVGDYVFCDENAVIQSEGYYEQPYIVSRYAVSTKERYGRGPAVQYLPDIAMLNEMNRTVIEAAAMTVDPPLLSHEMVSEFDLVPGAYNPGTLDDNGRALVQAFSSRTDPGITLEMIRDVRQKIDDGFLGLYFRVLLENPQMTATQAMLIAQQQGQMTTPIIGRLQEEWLGPMIRRESGILYREGKHPQMPEVLKEYFAETREPMRIEYESPMARAARGEDAVAMLRGFEGLAPMAQIDPSVYDVIDPQEASRAFLEVSGFPARAMRSRQQAQAVAQGREQTAEMGMALQAAPVAAQAAKTLAEAQRARASIPTLAG